LSILFIYINFLKMKLNYITLKRDLDEKLKSIARNNKELEEANAFLEFEKKAAETEVSGLREKIEKLGDELAQANAHIDLYKVQIHEENEECERYKVKYLLIIQYIIFHLYIFLILFISIFADLNIKY